MFDRFSVSRGVSEMYLGCIWGISGGIWGVSGTYLRCIWMYLDVSGGYLGVSGVHLWWPSAAECWVTPRIFLIFYDFYQKCPKKSLLSPRRQIACKSRKTTSYVFCIFTPLYRRFSLSSLAHGSGFDEIYRLLSKILHFMPPGSISENLPKIYRKSIENLSKIYRKPIEHLSNIYRKSIENLSNIYRKSIALGSIWGGSGVDLGWIWEVSGEYRGLSAHL